MSQRQPDAADPEVRVHLGGSRQELQRLVTADIQGAQCDSAPVERFSDLAVDGELLLDVRRVLASQEQELGAHQAHEIRTVGGCRPGVIHRSDVGAHRNRDTVAGDRGLGGAGARLALALREGGDAGPELLAASSGGSTTNSPRPPSTTTMVPSGMDSTVGPAPTTTGIPFARRRITLCGVRAAEGQQNRGDRAGSSSAASAGVEVGCDQHTGRDRSNSRRCRASPAGLDRLPR